MGEEITINSADFGELLVEVFQRGARQGRREVDETKVAMAKLVLDIEQLHAVMQRVHDEAPIAVEQETYWRSEMSAAIHATKPRE
jgi:hypothetical protein